MGRHQCSTCGQTCREFKPKKAAFDPTKRDRGVRCSGCNTKGINHSQTCPVFLGTRQRMLDTRPEDLRLDRAIVRRMSVLPYAPALQVGAVQYAHEADAAAHRQRQEQYEAEREAAREAHDAWTARWRAEAEAAYPEPETADPESEPLEAVA